jgi:hypothetical protein
MSPVVEAEQRSARERRPCRWWLLLAPPMLVLGFFVLALLVPMRLRGGPYELSMRPIAVPASRPRGFHWVGTLSSQIPAFPAGSSIISDSDVFSGPFEWGENRYFWIGRWGWHAWLFKYPPPGPPPADPAPT